MNDGHITRGRRLPDGEFLDRCVRYTLTPGDYGRDRSRKGGDPSFPEWLWFACDPRGEALVLDDCDVTEHPDGSISVEGEVVGRVPMPGVDPWIGTLVRGVWVEDVELLSRSPG